jgi:hypothetical protein
MFILDTHIHKLRFRIDADASEEYMNRWKKLKYKCEEGDNMYVIEKMKSYCKLESNRDLPYLQRSEGGIGGNDNIKNKQLRFRMVMNDWRLYIPSYMDNDIVFDQIYNTDTEKWSYEELDDLIYALTKTFNYFVEGEMVNGVIEMTNRETLSDNYLDSDDESG